MRAIIITVPFLLTFLYACEVDPFTFNLGKDLVVTSTKVTKVDTLTVQLSTFKKDSIVTSSKGSILAGVFHDELFGDITSRSYFQIGVPEDDEVYDSEICDSVSLILNYNQYYKGDTLQEQIYYIYELTEELEEEDDGSIYNFTSFSHSSVPLGSIRFYPKPLKGDELEITLDKDLGERMLAYLQENSGDLTNYDFLEVFYGFVIESSETESKSVLGFGASDSTLYLKLYTHSPGPMNPRSEHLLPMTNSKLQYNQIFYDLSCVPAFDSISEKLGLRTSCTEDIAYIYGGLGLYTKVTFPYLDKLTGVPELNNSILISVRLYLDPGRLNLSNSDVLENVRLYQTESNGDLGDVILNENSSEMVPDYYLDPIYLDETYLMFDITTNVNSEIADYYLDPEFGFYLDLTQSDAGSTLAQLMLDGSQSADNKMRLELTFFYYDL